MIQVKCINKIRDKQGIIQYYTLIDRQGNQKTVTAEALKRVIRNNQLECINLTLTSDNRLIDKSTKQVQKPVQTQKPAEMYKEYLNSAYMKKIRTLGIKPAAEYSLKGEDVILERVNIKTGTFEIPPFVTKLGIINTNILKPISPFEYCIDITLINKSNITDMSNMFVNCKELQSLDLSNFDTSKVTDMKHMFSNCENLQSLDLSSFDTSKVTDMQSMFSGCRNLQSLDLSKFDTSKVTYMRDMFGSCQNLQNLDLSSFDTSKVTSMYNMFYGCENLQSIDLSSFNTSQVIETGSMFCKCINLKRLDLSNFDTSKVEGMTVMFGSCKNLKNLDIRNFDMSQVKTVYEIFDDCNYTHTFKVPKCLKRYL